MEYTDVQRKKVEKAISFLVIEVNRYSRNPKPVILNSIQVGIKLMEFKVPHEVVIAGFLHDLIEDTNCSLFTIKKNFGGKVATYVAAMTMDYSISDYKTRWYDDIKRLKKLGRYAVLLKLIDSADNLPFYSRILKGRKKMKIMLWKVYLVLKTAKKDWGHLPLYKDFRSLYKEVLKTIKVSNEAEYFGN